MRETPTARGQGTQDPKTASAQELECVRAQVLRCAKIQVRKNELRKYTHAWPSAQGEMKSRAQVEKNPRPRNPRTQRFESCDLPNLWLCEFASLRIRGFASLRLCDFSIFTTFGIFFGFFIFYISTNIRCSKSLARRAD